MGSRREREGKGGREEEEKAKQKFRQRWEASVPMT
jgi:hypothetical protein